MVTAIIGRSFLTLYNQQNRTSLSAKEFFEQVFFRLFYDHPKYMQWVSNSPFVQMSKGQKPHLLQPHERLDKLRALATKVGRGMADASTAIGYPASEVEDYATTSGQVTDLPLATDEETLYCSWIGSGFAIGVAGGQLILFDNPDILNALFEGWHQYRGYLNDPAYAGLRGNQINTWNGQWLTHRFSETYRDDDPTRDFSDKVLEQSEGTYEVKTQTWLRLLLSVGRTLPPQRITGYVFKMGQTNSTYGFIPFELKQIQRPGELYKTLFGNYAYERDTVTVEQLYGSAFSFQKACQMGTIGVQALEPKGLRDYMTTGRNAAKNFKYDATNADNQITYKTYVTWLLAMLNKDEMWDEAGRAAELFQEYTKGSGHLKVDRSNQIDKLKSAPHQRQFIDAMVPLVENATELTKPGLVELAQKVNRLPSDTFTYFLTLIRLRYAEKATSTKS
ncbi:hypothetical protein [Fibrella aquatilis]|uniref:Uncharacterized protein n=1 Tax=Fibrella aquatilis TaxID=2817059 RepID=A0A939G6F3_9BACT|nr:hypothetical protein [Fibrella aquatilis]MBO0932068.1 hypothetical protein [Fibrella aquatilis]